MAYRLDLTIPDNVEQEYCGLLPTEKAAYVNRLKNIIRYVPYKKKTYDYNESAQRDLKKNLENTQGYRAEFYPEQEAAYQLGGILAGLSCELPQEKQALYYFSLAGRNPKTYLAVGIIFYRDLQTRTKSLDYFEKAARLGNRQAADNALFLLRLQTDNIIRQQNFEKFYRKTFLKNRNL